MARVLAGAALLVVFASCSDPVTVDGLCVAGVNVDGVMFHPGGGAAGYADPSAVSAEPYLSISRYTGCLDEGQPGDDHLAHGESNFLRVGTTLHRIAGFEPHEALAVWLPLIGEWEFLRPHAS